MNIPVFHDDQHGTAIIVGAAVLNALEMRRQEDRRGEARHQRRRRRRHRLPRHAGRAGHEAGEHPRRRPRRRALHRPRPHGPGQAALRARHRQAHAGRHRRRRRHVPRPVRRRRAQAGDGRDDGRRARSSSRWPIRIRKSCRRTPRRCARTASSPPAVRTTRTRSTTRCASPTSSAARSTSAPPTINEAMKLACVRAIAAAGAHGVVRPRQRLRRRGAELRPRLPDPASVRPAPAGHARAGRGAARRWTRASPRGRSPTSSAYEEKLGQFIYRTGLLMKPCYDRARSDRKRVVYAEGEEETVLRAVQTVIDEGLALPDPDRPPGRDRDAHRAPGPAHARRASISS